MPRKAEFNERYRPQFHFTARENWLNDPNGCVYCDGVYHLFFQHNPKGRDWGNMSWGHAVSTDLVHWHQLANAIEPYDGGTIFSGSAVADTENRSGFGRGQAGPLVAAFTHARNPFGQAIAFSNDKGNTWELYGHGRHVVPNQGLDDSDRDPKILWHAASRKWIMVLWVQLGRVRFFTSGDLKQWRHAGDFIGEDFYECPDLFALPVDGNPHNVKWVLLDAAFKYWIGSFDGNHFLPEAGPFRGDFGGNFYAAQTWNNTGARIIQIGWMRGGEYPGMPFNQQMSFPCELAIRTTPAGIRLVRMPVATIENLRIGHDTVSNSTLHSGEELTIGKHWDLFDITAEIEMPPHAGFGIRLHELDISCANGRIRCLGKEAPLSASTNVVSLRLLVDRTSIEVYVSRGEVCMSSCFLPSEKDTNVRCYAGNDPIHVRSLTVHRLRSAWEQKTA